MGPDEFSTRWAAGQRLIQTNGVTYNVYGDPRGSARPWPLDLVPLVIDAREWTHIEAAVIQRATLLNTGRPVSFVVDMAPSDHVEQAAYLRVVDLPANQMSNTVMVIKLEFEGEPV